MQKDFELFDEERLPADTHTVHRQTVSDLLRTGRVVGWRVRILERSQHDTKL